MRAKTTPLRLLSAALLLASACGDDHGQGDAATDAGASTMTAGAGTSGATTDGSGGATGGASASDGGTTGAPGTTTGGDTTSPGDPSGAATTGDPDPTTTGPATTTGDPDPTTTTTTTTTGGGGLELPWVYIAATDRGIRDDGYGLGHFQAPRQGYKHSGIDFSMPVGTALYAPCDGAYLAGYDGGYGHWVQVICPIPATIAGDAVVYASLLFAHLDTLAVAVTGVDPDAAGVVARGQTIGAAGKSGNASAAGIHAHLHFEAALHASELDGLLEAHISGADQDTPAAAALRASIAALCLEPTGFAPTVSPLHLGRRIDPFILLTCLTGDKPPLTPPGDQALHAWSDDYTADAFDVDVGM